MKKFLISLFLVAICVFGLVFGLKANDKAHAMDVELIQTTSPVVQLKLHPYALEEDLVARIKDIEFREVTAIWADEPERPDLPVTSSWIIATQDVAEFVDALAAQHLEPALNSFDRRLVGITIGEPVGRSSYYSGFSELGWVVTQVWRIQGA